MAIGVKQDERSFHEVIARALCYPM